MKLYEEIAYGFLVENRRENASLVEQVHGDGLFWVRDSDQRMAMLRNPPEADAVATRSPGIELFVYTADCLPALIYSERTGVVAAVHAGWRGTKQSILSKTIREVGGHLSKVILGPCLGVCCFEVKEDFILEFEKIQGKIDPFVEERSGRYYFNLVGFTVERELREWACQLDLSAVRCTYCSEPRLPSYRRNRSTDPRIRAWIRRAY